MDDRMSELRELTLRELIALARGSRTYAQLQRDSGDVVKAQRWNQIYNGIRTSEFPNVKTIAAMAEALHVDAEVVLLAWARSVGLTIRSRRSAFADLLPEGIEHLSATERQAILDLIRSMAKRQPPPPPA